VNLKRLPKETHTTADLHAQLIINSEIQGDTSKYGREYIRTHLRQKDYNILKLYYIRTILYCEFSILTTRYLAPALIEP